MTRRLLIPALGIALLAGALIATPPATAADISPRAGAKGTPLEILGTVPATPALRVGYARGSFPVVNPLRKDKRGCTQRNQLLIKLAVKKPKVGKGCRLTGGAWKVDFGARTETNPAKVRVMRLLPDVYVYGQGGYMWSPAQRAAYTSYVAPRAQVRAGLRGIVINDSINQSSLITISNSNLTYMTKLLKLLTNSSNPDEATLAALRLQNPALFAEWSIATLLNAKAWGFSLSPAVHSTFQTTLTMCGPDLNALLNQSDNIKITDQISNINKNRGKEDSQPYLINSFIKANPCTQTYTVTTPSAEDPTKPGSTTTYNLPAMPAQISAAAPVLPGILKGYTLPATGDVVSRHLFGLHAPAIWSYDATDQVDGPVNPRTIPNVPVGYVRLWDTETTWADLEPSKGSWVWRKLAKQIQVAQARDAKVMLVLGGTPEWASANGQKSGNPKSLDEWRNYVSTVCRQFGPSISAYEIWNEANLMTFYAGTPAQMADLTKAAFEEIRRCNPGALVVAANTTSRAEGSFATFFPAYLQELKARGWPADAYSVHSYPKAAGGNGDRIAGVSQFRLMLALAGAPFTTTFDTEVNYGMEGLGQGKVEITGEKAAALMSRTYIDSVRYGFGSTFWYVWTPQPDPKMGIQFTPDAVVEQKAWNTTYDWLVGAQYHGCGDALVPTGGYSIPKGLIVCQFDRGGTPFTLAWFGEVNTDSSTILPAGYFNGLGSQCQTLLGGDCKGILEGTAPITSTPIRISGPALATVDTPTSIVLRPQPLPTISTGQTTPITVIATNAEGKYLAGERLSIAIEGTISIDGGKGPIEVTTGDNGLATVNVKGDAVGTGRLTITAPRNPALSVSADLTVANQQVVLLSALYTSREGDVTANATISGFPRGYLPNTRQRWGFWLVELPKRTQLMAMRPLTDQQADPLELRSNYATVEGRPMLQVEARLIDEATNTVVKVIASNRLQKPLPDKVIRR